jgi:hypothetical protein
MMPDRCADCDQSHLPYCSGPAEPGGCARDGATVRRRHQRSRYGSAVDYGWPGPGSMPVRRLPPPPKPIPPWRPGDGYQPLATKPARPRHGIGEVTAVIPTAFRPGVVGEAIESVLAQTRAAEQILVVVNGFDNWNHYTEPLRSYRGKPRLHILYARDPGIPEALNAALPWVRTEYIAVHDDDDVWAPDFLATMVGALDADPCAGLALCEYEELRADKRRPADPKGRRDLEGSFDHPWWIFPSLLFRVACLGSDGFDPRSGGCCDWDTILRCWVGSGRMAHVNASLATHRVNGDNTSHRNPLQKRWEEYLRGKRASGAYGPAPEKPRVALGVSQHDP